MRRCAFLDRDGVINRKAPAGEYIIQWSDFHLIPAIVDWIRLLKSLDFLIVVITNQRGVARGKMTEEQLVTIHERMFAALDCAGAHIDDLFFCPHEENSCLCRKPHPGMVMQARAKWNIDLEASLLIGDSETDRQLAECCGIRFIKVSEGKVLEIISPSQAVRS